MKIRFPIKFQKKKNSAKIKYSKYDPKDIKVKSEKHTFSCKYQSNNIGLECTYIWFLIVLIEFSTGVCIYIIKVLGLKPLMVDCFSKKWTR